jgi:hypothetical protein
MRRGTYSGFYAKNPRVYTEVMTSGRSIVLVVKCGLPSSVLIDPAASADTQDDILGFNPNLQKNDRSNHRDDHYHDHGQPDSPAFLLSRSLSCLRCLIPRGPLCGPSCLLLLSGFLTLRHVLPLFPVRCGALHWGLCKPPHMLGQRMS